MKSEQDFEYLARAIFQRIAKKLEFRNIVIFVVLCTFIIRITYFLISKPIVDYDVAAFFLPASRQLSIQGMFPEATQTQDYLGYLGFARARGYFGLYALYTWIYELSGSILYENYRLTPVLFIMMTALGLYLIGRELSVKHLDTLSVVIFCVLPGIDRLLFYSYYGDLAFMMFSTLTLFLSLRYQSTKNYRYALLIGLTIGTANLIKPQAIMILFGLIALALFFIQRRWIRLLLPLTIIFTYLLFIGKPTGESLFGRTLKFSTNLQLDISHMLPVIILVVVMIIVNEFRIKQGIEYIQPDHKFIISIVLAASPFLFLLYLRNLFLFGQLQYSIDTTIPNVLWAVDLLSDFAKKMTPQLGLVTLIGGFTAPILGTAWMIPNIYGIYSASRLNFRIFYASYYYVGFFALWWLFIAPRTLTDRHLFTLIPLTALFISLGLIRLFKHCDQGVFIFVVIYLLFSLPQYFLLKVFPVSPFSELANIIVMAFKLESNSLNSIFITSDIKDLMNQLYFAFVSSLPLLCFQAMKYVLSRKKIKILTSFNVSEVTSRLLSIHFKELLVILIILLSSIQFIIVYKYGDSNPARFTNVMRSKWDYGGLHSNIIPYLRDNVEQNNTILGLGIVGAGLPYYLPLVKMIDLTIPEILAEFHELKDADYNNLRAYLNSHQIKWLLVSDNPRYNTLLKDLSQNISLFFNLNKSYLWELIISTRSWTLYKIFNPLPIEYRCVLHLPFNEGDGSNVFDLSSNSNDGIINGASWVYDSNDTALSFDGEDDYIKLRSSYDLVNKSLCFWGKKDIGTGGMSQGIWGNNIRNWDSYIEWTKSDFIIEDVEGGRHFLSHNLTTTQQEEWNFFVFISDGINIKIYVNGNLEDETSLTTSTMLQYIGVGYAYSGYNNITTFNGTIDEVRLYERSLRQYEIFTLFLIRSDNIN